VDESAEEKINKINSGTGAALLKDTHFVSRKAEFRKMNIWLNKEVIAT
jgi:hypothetical protein